MLVGIAANGHHEIERDVAKFGDVLGSLAGNIHARLGHDADRIGVQAVRFDPSGIRLDGIALEFACPSLGHLAAAGIAGAEKKNLRLVVHWTLRQISGSGWLHGEDPDAGRIVIYVVPSQQVGQSVVQVCIIGWGG